MAFVHCPPLLIGEVCVDVTITPQGEAHKLRLGGIAHAARGFWASGCAFRAGVLIPEYLEQLVRKYFQSLGCSELRVIGTIECAPNVTLIFDPTEVADQEYETLLRDEKTTRVISPAASFDGVTDALIFPGSYSLEQVCAMLPENCGLHIDAAYDLPAPDKLAALRQPIRTLFYSTSSPLQASLPTGSMADVVAMFSAAAPAQLIYKENRGGAQLYDTASGTIHALPAQLGTTVNSVGVGDVFAAAYVAGLVAGPVETGWRATRAAAAYSQTTVPDLFQQYVRRAARLSLEAMQELGGTSLPWAERVNFPIYLAAPDFTGTDRVAIDRALAALSYHHFQVRRPVQENGELPAGSSMSVLLETYGKDCQLLHTCAVVFAVPTGRDPGTLVEIGLAIAAGKPVITFDPKHECNNTMVIAGSTVYSDDLDLCLNGVFESLSRLRT